MQFELVLYSEVVIRGKVSPDDGFRRHTLGVSGVNIRGQVLTKNSWRQQDFWFSNRHSPTQDLIALALLNPVVPLESFPKKSKILNFCFTILSYFGTVLKYKGC